MKSVMFFHRSVGHNLIHDGKLYELLKKTSDFAFSDYDQNTDILTNVNTQRKAGFSFPGGNTRPADYAVIFSETTPIKYKTIQDLALSHDIIVIKSCYPNSNIRSDAELEMIKQHYQAIADFFAKQPAKTLIILTSPPLTPLMTKPDRAARARQLTRWLTTTSFGSNVKVFDFFDLLATPEHNPQPNMLQRAYRRWLPFDSHPNFRASQTIAPLFIQFLSEHI